MKILVADDDAAMQAMLAKFLRHSGYDVIQALDGDEALAMVFREAPDLILLDCAMPKKTGTEVLHEIRRDPRSRMLPVIFETAAGGRDDIVRGLAIGADDYLPKPFELDVLGARIQTVLRRCSTNLDANPLTRLPGSAAIEREIRRLLDDDKAFSVLYVDLNEFKAYNDFYGSHRGDAVICATADILREMCGASAAIVGHIGGDDFVVVTEDAGVEDACRRIIAGFDAVRMGFYDESERTAGFIAVVDRRGERRNFAPVSVAIGVVTSRVRKLRTVMEVSAIGAEVKAVAKRQKGSAFFIDRRKDDYPLPQVRGPRTDIHGGPPESTPL